MSRLFLFAVLLAAALGLALLPGAAHRLAGFPPLAEADLTTLDDPPRAESGGATPLFEERNQLQVRVPRAMTALDFLRLCRLQGSPHVRRQLAEQLGIQALPDDYPLQPGRTFTITLTRPEEATP